ncbi:putative cupin superfamily protein [Pelomonas saccharophila]|uniref:Cupin superfamily protein n=1 Tax=Roseateles saccharophilus TaxID=304 RepID=A0ABU1YV49_ROSSA|nr:cupin domain-containing protein [Roseateles saccharophilus]MDR7272744.1 putative cupin superfamily protein [Roseateles saccharophilus]
MKKIVLIDSTAGLEPVHDQPREDRRVNGAPRRRTWTFHEHGPMSAGIWACEVGRWRSVFPAGRQEYFHVLEGRVRLHGPHGEVDIGPGQGGVIPPGFEGEFEVLEPVRKHFVLVDVAS